MNTNIILRTCLCIAFLLTQPVAVAMAESNEQKTEHQEHTDDHAGENNDAHGDEHDEEGLIKLTPEQIQAAGIVIEKLQMQTVSAMISAPGEARLNAYRTVKITPRIPAQVVARHARLGDEVVKGQSLITLSSVEMAEAQGALMVSDREWKRVKKLGREVVSERRFIEAQVKQEQARSKVQAYGMTEEQITELLSSNKPSSSNGTFQLLSPQAGRILHDEFIVGERVEAGHELMEIADESVMWVEAHISPNQVNNISVGNQAGIQFADQRLAARVSQIHHTLDETTRTIAIRLEVENKDDKLHPGMFVTANIETSESSRALTLPEAAVLRSPDGDWQVLVEQDEAGEFKAVEVKLVRVSDGKAVIEGLEAGTPVVTQGAFFVQSELAKSGFDIHNH